jgi:hypothetical protein
MSGSPLAVRRVPREEPLWQGSPLPCSKGTLFPGKGPNQGRSFGAPPAAHEATGRRHRPAHTSLPRPFRAVRRGPREGDPLAKQSSPWGQGTLVPRKEPGQGRSFGAPPAAHEATGRAIQHTQTSLPRSFRAMPQGGRPFGRAVFSLGSGDTYPWEGPRPG